MKHYNLVHKPIPFLQAMKIPDAKAAVDKEWAKLKNLSAWRGSKVKGKKEVIEQAQREGKTVHLATRVDLCHLEKSELETSYKKKNAVWSYVAT